MGFFDELFASPWVVAGVKVLLVTAFFLTAPMAIGYTEHKVLAHMQHRMGPMEAGRFHGWAQLIADGIKFIQKEDVVPDAADRRVFSLAPAVFMVPVLLIFAVIPFGPDVWALNLDVGIFFVMAITAVSVVGILMAGWASANKFSLIGALRAAGQLIAYELPLILAAVSVAMLAGTLSLVGIVEAQRSFWFVVVQPLGFGIFMVASLAELTRAPFDMPIAESELIFGAMTEYTGMKFAFFLLAEYAGIVAFSAIAATLFLGGYLGPILPPPIWMFLKIGGLGFLIIWLRATYPRLREDQLQRFSWIILIPLALVQILITAVVKVAVS